MFAIYNKNGLSFRSTIDNLYDLSNVDSLAKVRNNVEEGLPKDHSEKRKKKFFEGKSEEEILQTYRKIANINNSEQIFQIKDLMTKDVITLNKNNTLREAYDIMDNNKIKQIPIMSSSNRVIGLLTQRMILDLFVNDIEYAKNNINKNLEILNFKEVLASDPVSDIRRVAKVMIDFNLPAIPVVDQNDNLQGIVSKTNILKAVANFPALQIWS